MTDEQEHSGPLYIAQYVRPEDERNIYDMIYSVHPDDRKRLTFKLSNQAWHVLVSAGLIMRSLYHGDTDRLLGYPVSICSDLDGLVVSLEGAA